MTRSTVRRPKNTRRWPTLIAEARGRGQPVLVGTTSIEKSEVISHLLTGKGKCRTPC